MKKLLLPLTVLAMLTLIAGSLPLQGQALATETPEGPNLLTAIGGDVTSTVFGVIATLLTVFVSPAITNLLKRWGIVDPTKAAAANMAVAFTISVLGWWLQTSVLHIPDLSTDLMKWIALGGFAGGLGQAGRSWIKNRVPESDRPLEGR